MPAKIRGKQVAYDNIAQGSAYAPSNAALGERTIAGETVSYHEMYGGGYCTSTSTGDVWHTNVAAGASVTDTVADGTVPGGAIGENLIAVATTMTLERLG